MKFLKFIKGRSCLTRCFGAILGAAALALSVARADAQTPFYHAPTQEIAGAPGTLIRSEPMGFAPAAIARPACMASRSWSPA
jgi:hypothetical protein